MNMELSRIIPRSNKAAETDTTDFVAYKTKRRRRPDWLILVVVVLPVTIAVLYFGFLASDVYISESRFVVRSPEKPAASGLGVILKTAGFANAGDEVYAAQSYATSRDALRAINRGGAFKKAYSRPEVSPFDRFNGSGLFGSFEHLYQYFQGKVTLTNDTTTSITTLTVRAFTPEDAQRFNKELLDLSEATVNRLNERGRNDLVRYAEREVIDAKERASRTSVALAAYRNRAGVVDPEKQAEVQMQMVSKLQDNLIAAKTELAQLQRYTPENPQIPVVQTQIGTIQRQMDQELGKVAGNKRSLAASAVQYQRLILESDFATKQLGAALASLQEAQSEAQRKQAYVERIVEPNLPDAPLEPRRLRGILATLALSLLAYGVARMIVAGVREHAQ
jgi:capsular polysaccharide transport system permease protein